MKTFLQFLLVGLLLFSHTHLLHGQWPLGKVKFGLGAQALISSTSIHPFQVGMGNSFQIWSEKQINTSEAINLTLAFREQAGYDSELVEIVVKRYPSENQILTRTKEVAALYFWDTNLTWQRSFRQQSPWSFALGLRTSILVHWKGKQLESVWSAFPYGSISDNGFGTGGNGLISHEVRQHQSSRLASDNFNRLDFGLQFYLSYRLLPGLRVTTGLDQGLLNIFRKQLFANAKRYRISSFSVGMAVRMF